MPKIKSQKTATSPKSDKELIEIGKMLDRFYEIGYVNKKQALGYTFAKGIAQGVGLFVGGTVVVAVGLWLLGQFTWLPSEPLNEALKSLTQ